MSQCTMLQHGKQYANCIHDAATVRRPRFCDILALLLGEVGLWRTKASRCIYGAIYLKGTFGAYDKQQPAKSRNAIAAENAAGGLLWIAGRHPGRCGRVHGPALPGGCAFQAAGRASRRERNRPAGVHRLSTGSLAAASACRRERRRSGPGDFMAQAERVRVHIDAPSLGRGVIDIPRVDIVGLEATLPVPRPRPWPRACGPWSRRARRTPRPHRRVSVRSYMKSPPPKPLSALPAERALSPDAILHSRTSFSASTTGVLEGECCAGNAASIHVQANERHPGRPAHGQRNHHGEPGRGAAAPG